MFRREPRHFANVASISLNAGERWPSGAFQLYIAASPAVAFVQLDSSDNLQTWSSAGSVYLSNGTTNFLDGLASPSRRFYRVSAGNYRSINPYGYITADVPSGWSIIANQLSSTNNAVRSLFNGVPSGTSIWKKNETTGLDEQATFSNGSWSGPNFMLVPGEGATIYNPTPGAFHVTFVGEVLQGYLVNTIPAGSNRRSSMVPQSSGVTSGLLYPPGNGDQFQRLTAGGTLYTVATYTAPQWTPSEPVPAFGEGFVIYTGTSKNWTRTFSVWP